MKRSGALSGKGRGQAPPETVERLNHSPGTLYTVGGGWKWPCGSPKSWRILPERKSTAQALSGEHLNTDRKDIGCRCKHIA